MKLKRKMQNSKDLHIFWCANGAQIVQGISITLCHAIMYMVSMGYALCFGFLHNTFWTYVVFLSVKKKLPIVLDYLFVKNQAIKTFLLMWFSTYLTAVCFRFSLVLKLTFSFSTSMITLRMFIISALFLKKLVL